jgi:hypothetical protein
MGYLSFKPVALTNVSPDVTASWLCGYLIFGNSLWQCVKINVLFAEEIIGFLL